MPTRDEIEEYLENIGESPVLMDGFDEAFLGTSQRINEPLLAVYSYQKMVEVLMFRDSMSYDDAMEHIEFNSIGAWVGARTPIIVRPLDENYEAWFDEE